MVKRRNFVAVPETANAVIHRLLTPELAKKIDPTGLATTVVKKIITAPGFEAIASNTCVPGEVGNNHPDLAELVSKYRRQCNGNGTIAYICSEWAWLAIYCIDPDTLLASHNSTHDLIEEMPSINRHLMVEDYLKDWKEGNQFAKQVIDKIEPMASRSTYAMATVYGEGTIDHVNQRDPVKRERRSMHSVIAGRSWGISVCLRRAATIAA